MMALMRKVIRNNYLYRILLWMFLIMMAVGGGLLVNFGQEKDWVIKVYDNLLSSNKFQLMLKASKHQQEEFRQKGITIAGKDIGKDTVAGAVSSLLGEHVMDSLSLNVPDYLVEQGMRQHLSQLPPYFFKNGELDLDMFKRYITPYTIDGFIDDIYLEKKHRLFYDIIDLAIYTPEYELALQYNIDFAEKSYSILNFPLQKYIKQAEEKEPSEEVLSAYYKKSKNNESFKSPEKRAGKVWRFNADAYGSTISDADIKNYYDKNKHKYLLSPSEIQVRILLIKQEAGKESDPKKQIEALKEKAESNPEDFAQLVKEFSQDEDLKSKGGLTGFFSQDSDKYDKALIKAAFEGLSKPGQISSPIKTSRGYELVQLVKRNPAKHKELTAVEGEIKKELIATKFKQRFSQDASRVISQAKYKPEVLQNFIDRHKGVKKELPLKERSNRSVDSYLFKTEEHRYATFFDKGEGVILLCTEIEKSKVPPLEDVKKDVLEKYYEQEGKKLLEKDLDAALLQAKKTDFSELAKKYKVSVQSASFEFKDGSIQQSDVLKPAKVQSSLKNLHAVGAVSKVLSSESGLLIRLDSISDRDDQLFEDQKDKLSKTMFYAKKYQVKEGFIASLYRRAKLNNKIQMKDEVLQFIKEA